MAGYQESVTDPSFAGQLLTFTYPHIGNYGVSQEAMESDRIWTRGVIMRAATNGEDAPTAEGGWLDWLRDCGVVAIDELDTRALVKHLRDKGSMRGGIFPASIRESEARAIVDAEPHMAGQDLVKEVSPTEMTEHGTGDGPLIAALDTGIQGLDRSATSSSVAPGCASTRRAPTRRCSSTPAPTRSSSRTALAIRRPSTTSSAPSAP